MHNKQEIKILFFSDTHLGFDYPIRPRIKRRRRGFDFFDNFHHVLDYAKNQSVDLIVHGGDLFFRSKIPKPIIPLVYKPLNEVAQAGIPIFIVPGNHERSQLPNSNYLEHQNIHIFDQPKAFIHNICGIRIALTGIPFVRHNIRDNLILMLEQTGWQNQLAPIRLLCLHQTIQGSRVEHYVFNYGKDVIRRKDLPSEFDAVLAGHIHRCQILKSDVSAQGRYMPPVIYSGSTERTSFAEKNERKGFIILKFVPLNESDWRLDKISFHSLPTRPMVNLVLDDQFFAGINPKKQLQTILKKYDHDSIVKINPTVELDEKYMNFLTAPILREIAPASMNIQLSIRNYQKIRDMDNISF